jgi:hypothetical protein
MFWWAEDLKNQFVNILFVSLLVLITRSVFGSSFPGVLLGLFFFSPLAISLLQGERTTISAMIRNTVRGKSLLYSIYFIFILIVSASIPGLVHAAFNIKLFPFLMFSLLYSLLFILSAPTFYGLAKLSSKKRLLLTDMVYVFLSMLFLGGIHYVEKLLVIAYPYFALATLFFSSLALVLILCVQVFIIFYRYQE